MNRTKIEWCTRSINIVTGCTFGCPYCYAKQLYRRFNKDKDFSIPETHFDRLPQLDDPHPQIIFMDSMSDIADWSNETVMKVLEAMQNNPQHVYLFLTKRPLELPDDYDVRVSILPNVWTGASITNNVHAPTRTRKLGYVGVQVDDRIQANRFISFEPLLDHIDLTRGDRRWPDNPDGSMNFSASPLENMRESVKWVIIGAESGKRGDKVVPDIEWIYDIVTVCDALRIPVFMKDSLIPIVGETRMRREFPKLITDWINDSNVLRGVFTPGRKTS